MALFTQQTRKDEFSSRAESRVEPSVELDSTVAVMSDADVLDAESVAGTLELDELELTPPPWW